MPATEVELKLALSARDAARLAQVPALARIAPTRERLYSIYHDTPALDLLRRRVALRLRREGEGAQARWLQTLKTAGDAASALSRRGEWEMPVAGPALEPERLAGTPWDELDPGGDWAAALRPCFSTDFERTRWLLRARGGAVIEVALDCGQITGGGRSEPLCELELELLQGPPEALLTLARRIARHVA
ncbi:MAG TPA: CYTH domain-containing protein, partial [Alicycliphilus sp.]|nr:CYTH domain-containing protein [Alicycliphilus sp.]